MSSNIDNSQDVINSTDIIEAISDLENELDDKELEISDVEEEIGNLRDNEDISSDETDEIMALEEDLFKLKKELQIIKDDLEELENLQDEFEGYCPDWKHGVSIIRETYIDTYLKEELEDCGYIPKDFPSWIEIDWDATFENMKQDYTEGDYDGVTYYAR